MKRVLSTLLVILIAMSLCGCGDSSGPASDTPSTPADIAGNNPQNSPEDTAQEPDPAQDDIEEVAYEVTYTNAKIYTNSIGTVWSQVIVEIENTGSSDLYLSSGAYDLEDTDGNLIASETMVSTYPDVISPGEKAYMYNETTLDNAVEGDIVVLARPSVDKAKVDNIRYSVTDISISDGQYGDLKALGRVENTSDEDSSMTYIVIIMKDSNSTPIGQMFTILTDDLKAGDKIGFEMSAFALPDDITADSVADFIAYAYPMQKQF